MVAVRLQPLRRQGVEIETVGPPSRFHRRLLLHKQPGRPEPGRFGKGSGDPQDRPIYLRVNFKITAGQIFGEIEDEHDVPDLTEKQVGPDEYVLSCRLEVKYLNEKYGLGIEESREYDTLAGFIIFNYEGIPTAGETVFVGGLQVRILRTTRSRIDLARVRKL